MGKTVGVVLSLKDKCSPQLKKIADSMGLTEKEAKKLQKQTKELSKALGSGIKKAATVCTAAVGAMAVATQQLVAKTMDAGDRIDKMSQKIGMSRKSFQEWDYIMSQNGSSVDVLQTGYKKLATTMEGVIKGSKDSVATFNKLGVSVRDNNGALRKQEDVFNDSIRALQKIQNPTEKAILANKLFGKSAIELKPLLNQSSDSVDSLRKKANDLGMVMSDNTIDASVKLKDTMDTLKRSMGAMGISIGAEVIPIVQELADKIIANMPKIREAVVPIVTGMVGVLKFLADHMEVIIPLVSGVAVAFGAFKTIKWSINIITLFTSAVTTAGGVLKFFYGVLAANPIGIVVTLIGGLVAGVVYAYNKFEGFRKAVAAVWSVMKLLWSVIVLVGKAVYEKMQPFIKFGAILFEWLTPIGALIRGFKMLGKWIEKLGGIGAISDKVKGWADKKQAQVEAVSKGNSSKSKPKKHALGTSFSTGGPALVGENGPELVNLKRGDSVTPARKTQQVLNNNREIKVEVNIAGNVIGNMEFIQQIKNVLALELKTALAVR